MTWRDDPDRLRHMLDHAVEAMAMVQDRARDDLGRDRQLNLAVVRLLEIIGEAAARVSPAGRARLPGIAWPEIIGMRNRLTHAYDRIDLDIVWDVLRDDLPRLAAELRNVLPPTGLSGSESEGN